MPLQLITDTMMLEVMKGLNNGMTHKQAASYLLDKYGVIVDRSTISKRAEEFREIEREEIRVVVREAAQKRALDCIELIDTGILVISKQAMHLIEFGDVREKEVGRQLADTLLRYVDKKMAFAGMPNEDNRLNPNQTEMITNMLKKIGE